MYSEMYVVWLQNNLLCSIDLLVTTTIFNGVIDCDCAKERLDKLR